MFNFRAKLFLFKPPWFKIKTKITFGKYFHPFQRYKNKVLAKCVNIRKFEFKNE